MDRGHTILKEKLLSEVKLTERRAAVLIQKKQTNKQGIKINITFRDTLVPSIKEALIKKWNC